MTQRWARQGDSHLQTASSCTKPLGMLPEIWTLDLFLRNLGPVRPISQVWNFLKEWLLSGKLTREVFFTVFWFVITGLMAVQQSISKFTHAVKMHCLKEQIIHFHNTFQEEFPLSCQLNLYGNLLTIYTHLQGAASPRVCRLPRSKEEKWRLVQHWVMFQAHWPRTQPSSPVIHRLSVKKDH